MLAEKGRILFIFAAVLVLLGAAAVLYSPEAGLGINRQGMSGLIVGLAGALAAGILGKMALSGINWAVQGGMILTFALVVMCTHRALLAWHKVADGASDKWYAATVITLMGAASLVTLVAVARGFGGVRVTPTDRA